LPPTAADGPTNIHRSGPGTRSFGYHEAFHALVLLAAALHLAAVLLIVRDLSG